MAVSNWVEFTEYTGSPIALNLARDGDQADGR